MLHLASQTHFKTLHTYPQTRGGSRICLTGVRSSPKGGGGPTEALTKMTGSQKDVEYKICGMLTKNFLASVDKTLKIWGFIEENFKKLNFY